MKSLVKMFVEDVQGIADEVNAWLDTHDVRVIAPAQASPPSGDCVTYSLLYEPLPGPGTRVRVKVICDMPDALPMAIEHWLEQYKPRLLHHTLSCVCGRGGAVKVVWIGVYEPAVRLVQKTAEDALAAEVTPAGLLHALNCAASQQGAPDN